jgi:hypothetical protein
VSGRVALTDPPQPRYNVSNAEDLRLTREEFPAWEVFRGLSYIWFAEMRGAKPPLSVKAEELHILRYRIGLAIRHRARQSRG